MRCSWFTIVVFAGLSVWAGQAERKAGPVATEEGAYLLASYEPSEVNLTLTSRDAGMIFLSPVKGGAGDVPAATQGDYILKMQWAGESDHKVEIRHEWTEFSYDLAGYAQMLVDVYIASPSAIPQVVGIWWDSNFWTKGCPIPATANKWVTVAMNVDIAHQQHPVRDDIAALFFEGLAGSEGVIYIDNLRLVRPRQIRFAGYDWTIKSGDRLCPGCPLDGGWGGNYFSQRDENVSVDCNGDLHIRVVHGCYDLWYCSELISNNSWGYGTYVFTIQSPVDLLDENIILGLFTWDTHAPQYHYREIDFEFGKWGDPASENAQFVIQPWDTPGNRYRFDVGTCKTTTHVLRWQSNGIYFMSYYGDFTLAPSPESIIATWLYTGSSNPPPGGENIRMNLWLIPHNGANYPANGQDAEVVITDFRYVNNLFTSFAGCFVGPGGGYTPACRCADADSDADVDLADFAKFQAAFTD
jgi:hypothetical protein